MTRGQSSIHLLACCRVYTFTCPAVPATTSLLLYLHRLIFWMPSLGSSLYGSKQPTYTHTHTLDDTAKINIKKHSRVWFHFLVVNWPNKLFRGTLMSTCPAEAPLLPLRSDIPPPFPTQQNMCINLSLTHSRNANRNPSHMGVVSWQNKE